MKRVIVCGGRSFGEGSNDASERERQALFDALFKLKRPSEVVQGGALGADNGARVWAAGCGLPCSTFNADWNKHGKAAGPIRKQEMLDAGADLVVAFPGGRDTADMVRRARKAGVPVWEPLTGEDIPEGWTAYDTTSPEDTCAAAKRANVRRTLKGVQPEGQ